MKKLRAIEKKMKFNEVKTPQYQGRIETLTDRIPKRKLQNLLVFLNIYFQPTFTMWSEI
jgi:hypothetical protein